MKKVSSIFVTTALTAAGALLTGLVPASATQGEVPEARSGPSVESVVATHGPRALNAKKSAWGSARSCVEYSKTKIRCFDTHEKADKALGYSRANDPMLRGNTNRAVPACARGWTCLYEHANGGGRRLIFNDNYWHNLNEYNFDNKTSSWRNRQSATAYLAGGTGGRGGSIALSPKAYTANLGRYNDWASSIRA